MVMADLVEIVSDKKNGAIRKSPTSITVYLISNSGQGPSLEILCLPSEFIEFLFELHSSSMNARWQRIVHRTWRQGKGGSNETENSPAKSTKKSKTPQKPAPIGAGFSRNDVFNDLFLIFKDGFRNWHAATRFIRRHLLSDATAFYGDAKGLIRAPRIDLEQIELIDWNLTALFLRKVLGMNNDRIELIKKFATALADLIKHHNDRPLFHSLVFTEDEWRYRAILAKAQMKYARERGKLALGFDEYVNVFLANEPGERHSWSLVRDLISIRLVEHLFSLNFFDSEENRKALESKESEVESATNS